MSAGISNEVPVLLHLNGSRKSLYNLYTGAVELYTPFIRLPV